MADHEAFIAKAMELADEYARLQAVSEGEGFTSGADVTKAEQDAENARSRLEEHLRVTRGVTAGVVPSNAGRTLPHPGSPEASAMMDSLLAEYNWPANTKNAARAGWEAAERWLRGNAGVGTCEKLLGDGLCTRPKNHDGDCGPWQPVPHSEASELPSAEVARTIAAGVNASEPQPQEEKRK